MMSLVFFILTMSMVLIDSSYPTTQPCTCEQDYQFVVRYMEQNFPGFATNVTTENEAEYIAFKKDIDSKVRQVTTKKQCIKLLIYYVEYFKDNHTKIIAQGRGRSVNEHSDQELNKFYKSRDYLDTEVVDLKNYKDKPSPLSDIEGVYYAHDGTYEVTVVRDKTEFRDLIGVVTSSKSKLWKKGQVKFELREKEQNIFEGFFYNDYHQLVYKTIVPFNNGILGDGWFKREKISRVNPSLNRDRSFRLTFADDVAILRIHSFDGDYTPQLDSFYSQVQSQLKSTPYLIIDLRNNGGGNSSNFYKLLPYIYTRPIIDDEIVELYVTKDIQDLYEDAFREIMKDSTQTNAETIAAFREGLADLRSAPQNSFIPQGEEIDTTILTPLGFPKKVAVLYNRGCASACEDFLFKARDSEKTIFVGDNSGGYVGYGNMFTVRTPCQNIGLSCSTTRYSTQWKYEVVGITPDYKLSYDRDWIEQTIELLKR